MLPVLSLLKEDMEFVSTVIEDIFATLKEHHSDREYFGLITRALFKELYSHPWLFTNNEKKYVEFYQSTALDAQDPLNNNIELFFLFKMQKRISLSISFLSIRLVKQFQQLKEMVLREMKMEDNWSRFMEVKTIIEDFLDQYYEFPELRKFIK